MMLAVVDKSEGIEPAWTARAELAERNPRVLITTPWQKQVSPITAFCVSQLSDRRQTASMLGFGDAFVTHTRNTCGDVFLKSPCEWMLTIDDDMVVPFGNAGWYRRYTRFNFPEQFMAVNALDRLLSHGKTLVGALYFGRHPEGPPVYNEGAATAQELEFAKTAPHDVVKPTKWVGTGCMLIHRSVFEAIEKKFPLLARGQNQRGGNWFTSTEASVMEKIRQTKAMLEDGPLTAEKAYKALEGLTAIEALSRFENHMGVGEDVSFCLRALASGHQPYVDMGLRCGHLGHKVY